MAIIRTKEKSVAIPDGQQIRDACEELGVPFGCRSGICGTCRVDIIDGNDNLSELTWEEIAMGDRNRKQRLACQAKIETGTITIKFA